MRHKKIRLRSKTGLVSDCRQTMLHVSQSRAEQLSRGSRAGTDGSLTAVKPPRVATPCRATAAREGGATPCRAATVVRERVRRTECQIAAFSASSTSGSIGSPLRPQHGTKLKTLLAWFKNGETVFPLCPPLPLVGFSIAMERECQPKLKTLLAWFQNTIEHGPKEMDNPV